MRFDPMGVLVECRRSVDGRHSQTSSGFLTYSYSPFRSVANNSPGLMMKSTAWISKTPPKQRPYTTPSVIYKRAKHVPSHAKGLQKVNVIYQSPTLEPDT